MSRIAKSGNHKKEGDDIHTSKEKADAMLVKYWMSQPVVTISHKATMSMAKRLMEQNNFRALPVVRNDMLVGLLTDRALKRAEASDATTLSVHELSYLLEKISVVEIMTVEPKIIASDATIQEAADLFLAYKLSAVPVMDNKAQLVGILTSSDLERAVLKLTAFGRRGVQIGIRFSDEPETIMDVIGIVRKVRARLASLITTDGSESNGTREAFIHLYDLNRSVLHDLIGLLEKTGQLLYMIDLKTGERRIFDRSMA